MKTVLTLDFALKYFFVNLLFLLSCYLPFIFWHSGSLSRWDVRKFYKCTDSADGKVPKFMTRNFFRVTKVTLLDMGWIIANLSV
jgi:hypothetical protein